LSEIQSLAGFCDRFGMEHRFIAGSFIMAVFIKARRNVLMTGKSKSASFKALVGIL